MDGLLIKHSPANSPIVLFLNPRPRRAKLAQKWYVGSCVVLEVVTIFEMHSKGMNLKPTPKSSKPHIKVT